MKQGIHGPSAAAGFHGCTFLFKMLHTRPADASPLHTFAKLDSTGCFPDAKSSTLSKVLPSMLVFGSGVVTDVLVGVDLFVCVVLSERCVQSFETEWFRKLVCISYTEYKTNEYVDSRSCF